MSKVKTAYFCSNCGFESAKWTGKCPSCGTWNSFVEEVIHKDVNKNVDDWKEYSGRRNSLITVLLNEILSGEEKRIVTADAELNRTLGGGIVPGSLVLIAGEPGIGKSTLFLQDALKLKNVTTL